MKKKLTQEVFTRPDCPKWAKYAAVDFNGTAFWFEEKPNLGGYAASFWRAKSRTKYMCINGNFSRTVDLIERKQSQTNLDWLCKYPEVLAQRLIHFDAKTGKWLAPDGTAFYPRVGEDYFEPTLKPLRAGVRCHEYTVNWLKQEHKENNDDQKQS